MRPEARMLLQLKNARAMLDERSVRIVQTLMWQASDRPFQFATPWNT